MTHAISHARYSLALLGQLAAQRTSLALDPAVTAAIDRGAVYVREQVERGRSVYGVTTGFGALAERPIPRDQLGELQRRHVISHACGVGAWAPEPIARLALLIKLLTFRSGHTGIAVPTVERLIALWNRGVVPAICRAPSVRAATSRRWRTWHCRSWG